MKYRLIVTTIEESNAYIDLEEEKLKEIFYSLSDTDKYVFINQDWYNKNYLISITCEETPEPETKIPSRCC